jgi:head-tail adaptor
LNERVTIQRLTIAQNANGQVSRSWTTLITCWASVDGLKVDQSRREQDRTDRTINMYDYTVWVRSDILTRFDLKLSDRMVWRSKIFDIVDIPDQQLRGRLISIFVRNGATDG